jgi:hypothetical protein
MKVQYFWIEVIALCTAIACALALLVATLGAAAGATGGPESPQAAEAASTEQQVYEGMITDTRCGAKHKAAFGRSAGDCTRVCVHGGAEFALVDGDKTYILEGNLPLLKRIAGQRSRVEGTLNGNTITVTSLVARD